MKSLESLQQRTNVRNETQDASLKAQLTLNDRLTSLDLSSVQPEPADVLSHIAIASEHSAIQTTTLSKHAVHVYVYTVQSSMMMTTMVTLTPRTLMAPMTVIWSGWPLPAYTRSVPSRPPLRQLFARVSHNNINIRPPRIQLELSSMCKPKTPTTCHPPVTQVKSAAMIHIILVVLYGYRFKMDNVPILLDDTEKKPCPH
jgi:hypothetical protein